MFYRLYRIAYVLKMLIFWTILLLVEMSSLIFLISVVTLIWLDVAKTFNCCFSWSLEQNTQKKQFIYIFFQNLSYRFTYPRTADVSNPINIMLWKCKNAFVTTKLEMDSKLEMDGFTMHKEDKVRESVSSFVV